MPFVFLSEVAILFYLEVTRKLYHQLNKRIQPKISVNQTQIVGD